MQLRIQTTSPTAVGIIASLMLAGLLAVGAFRVVLGMHFMFAVAWWAAAGALIAGMMVGSLVIHLRQYTFDAVSRTLTTHDRWLYFLRPKPRSIAFSEIAAVQLRSSESINAVVVLESGKKLYPYSSGKVRQANRYCAAIKRITHVGQLHPAERRARGRAIRAGERAGILVAAAAVIVMAQAVLSGKLSLFINVAMACVSILLLLVAVCWALWAGRGSGSGVRERFGA